MTINKTSHSFNTYPFLNEEMKRTLRLRALKDEIFREALIADPKGVIQQLFSQSFPNGKLAEELTIKVIEEDSGTCHIVLPFLPDEVPTLEIPTLEIPEEERLEFVANMGADRPLKRTDSAEQRQSQPTDKKAVDITKQEYMRKQAGEAARKQETASEPLTIDKIEALARENKGFRQKLLDVNKQQNEKTKQEMFIKALREHFPVSNGSEGQTFKVIQDTATTRHLAIPELPDSSHDPAVPEGRQLFREAKTGGASGNKKCCGK